MKKIGVVLLVAAFTLVAANIASAQTVETTAKKLTISGGAEFTSVYKDAFFDNWNNNPYSSDRKSDAYVDVDYGLYFDFEFDKNVAFHLGFENESGDDFAGNYVTNTDFGGREITLGVSEGYIMMEDFIWPNFDFKVGIFNVKWDPIGEGCMFLDVHGAYGNMQEFGGWSGCYTSGDFYIAACMGTIAEMRLTGTSGLGTPSRPNARDTIECQAIHGAYNFPEGAGTLGFLLLRAYADNTAFTVQRNHGAGASGIAATAWNNVKLDFYDLGLAGKYKFMDWLSAYAELHMQFGDAGVNTPKSYAGQPGQAGADGLAFRIGFEGTYDAHEYKPWYNFSYVSFSGDEDANTRGVDDMEGFITQSAGLQRFLILEEKRHGLWFRTNYWILGLLGGIDIPDTPWTFSGGLALAEVDTADKVLNATTQGNMMAAAGQPKDASSDLGFEIDLCLKYMYSEDLTFTLGLGYLSGCGFNEESNTNVKSNMDPTVSDGEDSALMLKFTVSLEF